MASGSKTRSPFALRRLLALLLFDFGLRRFFRRFRLRRRRNRKVRLVVGRLRVFLQRVQSGAQFLLLEVLLERGLHLIERSQRVLLDLDDVVSELRLYGL